MARRRWYRTGRLDRERRALMHRLQQQGWTLYRSRYPKTAVRAPAGMRVVIRLGPRPGRIDGKAQKSLPHWGVDSPPLREPSPSSEPSPTPSDSETEPPLRVVPLDQYQPERASRSGPMTVYRWDRPEQWKPWQSEPPEIWSPAVRGMVVRHLEEHPL